ncbi:hypothetical protein BKA70DRAFT_1431640 [Coprinopsis sp. MPI-PUGE-AT-0042]|nr:hypothetical protein BKA70DRAFT_1431640 [Coprinopsis sp. MPI-PUGE-AT-0042]
MGSCGLVISPTLYHEDFWSALSLILDLAILWTLAQAQESDPEPLPLPQTFESLPYNFTFAAVNKNPAQCQQHRGAARPRCRRRYERLDHLYHFDLGIPSRYNDHPSLGLVNRALRAFDKLGNWGYECYHQDNSRVYSAVKDPSNEYPILAAYDISSLWSLCPDARFRGQTQLVFNVSAVTPPPLYLSFDPYLCYDVTVNLVPA